MSTLTLTASSLVEPGSPTSIALFVLVSLGVIGLVVTIVIRTRRRQREDPTRSADRPRGPEVDDS